MIPQVFPMNRGRPVRPDGMRGAGERQRERLLMQRIAELPLASDEKRSAPEPELVAVAAALLESDVTFGRAFGGACCGASAQRLLLAVYIAEGQDCELSLASVSSSAAFEPAAVSLRWAIKLLAEAPCNSSRE